MKRDEEHLLLWRNHQLLILPVKHNIIAPEHNISVNLEVGAAVALDAAKAGVGVDLGEGDGVSRDHGGVGRTHSNAKVG